MRPSCLDCARKHIAEAEILMREALMGYPLHSWLAIGHMSQAEAELIKDFPEMAHIIRVERINYLEGLNFAANDNQLDIKFEYQVDIMDIIEQLCVLEITKGNEE